MSYFVAMEIEPPTTECVITLQLLANDRRVVGDAKLGVLTNALSWLSVVPITTCVAALAASWF